MRNVLLFPLLIVVCLCLRSFGVSRWQEVPLWQQIIGFKYDLLPLLILLSAVCIGVVTEVSHAHQEVWWRRFAQLIFILLVVGLLRQVGKIYIPAFYAWWGYGNVGDFVQGTAPPLYYRTGPGGSMRLQGLFAGPNNLGFWLVGIASFRLVFLGLTKNKKLLAWGGGVFFVSLVRTISRGAWIGVCVQMLFLVYATGSQRLRRIAGWGMSIFVLGIVAVSLMKQGSSVAHLQAFWGALHTIAQQPFGYGLGMSGPAVHFGGKYLPENHFFQLILDIGIPGLLLWCASLFAITRTGFLALKRAWCAHTCISSPVALCMLGLCGLLVEGMFLHVFEDSMVSYLFLVPLGIAVGREMRKTYHPTP